MNLHRKEKETYNAYKERTVNGQMVPWEWIETQINFEINGWPCLAEFCQAFHLVRPHLKWIIQFYLLVRN